MSKPVGHLHWHWQLCGGFEDTNDLQQRAILSLFACMCHLKSAQLRHVAVGLGEHTHAIGGPALHIISLSLFSLCILTGQHWGQRLIDLSTHTLRIISASPVKSDMNPVSTV